MADLQTQFYEGELDNPDLCFVFAMTGHEWALESFKDIAAKRDLGAKGGKASGVSRNRRKELMEKEWLDIAAEDLTEDPDLNQTQLVARIMAAVAEGEEGYRADVGGNPIFGKSTISAFLKENIK